MRRVAGGFTTTVRGAALLRPLALGAEPLLLVKVVAAGIVNLLIASASAKWALMAPVFVPMPILLGGGPAETQAPYRVGVAVTNVLTPLLPYVPIVLGSARRYVPEAGRAYRDGASDVRGQSARTARVE